jgi:diacylglycerol O-acyltransferase / wax synthase
VLTNVPGPSHRRLLCGKTVDDLMFWVPAVGDIGIVISTISYGDQLSIGLVTDDAVPCPPGAFLEEFVREFEAFEILATGGEGKMEKEKDA